MRKNQPITRKLEMGITETNMKIRKARREIKTIERTNRKTKRKIRKWTMKIRKIKRHISTIESIVKEGKS